jgi:hypothetical protein
LYLIISLLYLQRLYTAAIFNMARKYLQKKKDDSISVGNLIHWHIKQQHAKKKDIANELDILPTTLNQYFKQPSLQSTILWRIGKAINYNFFMYLGEKINIPYETEKERELKQIIAQQAEELKQLETKIEVYKELTQKK